MTTFRMALMTSALIAVACSSVAAETTQQRRMGFVDLLNVPGLTDPQLSPDARQLLYVLSESDWKANRQIAHIWRTKTDGTGAERLTNGLGEQGARWSPDGKTIAFSGVLAAGGTAQVYLLQSAGLEKNGDQPKALTHHASSVSRVTWAPDGKSIYFTAVEPKPPSRPDDVYAYQESTQNTHLWRVALDTGVETRITSGPFSIVSYQLSQDGRKIVYNRARGPLLEDRLHADVWLMDADGSHSLQLTDNDLTERGASLSPDNSQVMFLAEANEKLEPYYNRKIFLMSASGGAAKIVSPRDATYEVLGAKWSKDGKSIYFVANMGVHAEVFVMPSAGGTPKQLTDGKHDAGGYYGFDARLSVAADHVAFTVNDPTNPGDVWMLKPGASQPTQVTHVFDYLAKTFDLPRQEAIQWKGADGVTVEGILFYPVGYERGRKYPLVVMPHGGPAFNDKLSFGDKWSYQQVLAAKGYAVLLPNYRGSTGYGDPFLRDMVGSYFRNAHRDVLAGTDEAIRRGVADPDRLILMGWSGGGIMTNFVITETDRFKAASASAGVANWISMIGQSGGHSDGEIYFGGMPWQNQAPIDVYWANSALRHVARVKTPTLLFVGEQDIAVPMPQSVEMYEALKYNGVPTHLYVAPEENHMWEGLRQLLFKMNAELEWFEKYANHRSYTWETAPGGVEIRRAAQHCDLCGR
jgi:dipeptidyl aminopeptidase/acylaminoacyl peptidase